MTHLSPAGETEHLARQDSLVRAKTLMAQSIYGGRVDNEPDQRLLNTFRSACSPPGVSTVSSSWPARSTGTRTSRCQTHQVRALPPPVWGEIGHRHLRPW